MIINFSTLLNQIMTLFLLILIGFIIKKIKLTKTDFFEQLSTFIIYVTLPALIITSMNYDFSLELLRNVAITFLATVIIYLFMVLVANFMIKPFALSGAKGDVYRFLIVFANVGFMGYPVTYVIFGSEGVFLASIYNLVFNIMLWTVGIVIITPNSESVKYFNLKKLLNPGILAIILGFVLFLSPIKLPVAIIEALNILGDTTIPLAMIVVGSALAQVKISSVFYDTRLWLVTVLRLLLLPIATFLILSLLPINELVAGVLILLTGMPAATNTAIFAQQFDSDTALASKGVFLTTLLSIITVPLLAMLLL